MRLNVGCGDHYAEGWTNLDAYPGDAVRPDIVADFTAGLPAVVQGVKAVYLGHVLEHLPIAGVVPALQGLWERCTPGAVVGIVGPDCDRARALLAAGEIDEATAVGAIEGARRWPGDEHLWECGGERLLTLALASGLDARLVGLDDPVLESFPVVSRAGWQCAIVGVVPGAQATNGVAAWQAKRYRDAGHPEGWGLWAAGVIVRRHTAAVKRMGAAWAKEVAAGSARDQVSQPFVLREAKLRPASLPGTHLANRWLAYEGSGRH